MSNTAKKQWTYTNILQILLMFRILYIFGYWLKCLSWITIIRLDIDLSLFTKIFFRVEILFFTRYWRKHFQFELFLGVFPNEIELRLNQL